MKVNLIPSLKTETVKCVSVPRKKGEDASETRCCLQLSLTCSSCSSVSRFSMVTVAGNRLVQGASSPLMLCPNALSWSDRFLDCSRFACSSSYQFCQPSCRSDQSSMKPVSFCITVSFCGFVLGSATMARPRASMVSTSGCLVVI